MSQENGSVIPHLAGQPEISVQLTPSHRPNVLSGAVVTIQTSNLRLEIHDVRVLRNRNGILWAALPTYSVTVGKLYDYKPCVVLDPALHRRVTDAVLAEFEKTAAQSGVSDGH